MESKPQGCVLQASQVQVDNRVEASTEEILEPVVLLLAGESILMEGQAPPTPLYQLSRSVTSFSSKQSSSAIFERVEVEKHQRPEKAPNSESTTKQQRNRRLFHLVHPVNARYRTDVPAYYMTSISPSGMIGNVQFETSKPRRFQKTEFKALLSANKSSSDRVLFHEMLQQQQLLFSVKSKTWRGGGRYQWTDANGGEIAIENNKNGQHKLVVTAYMTEKMRDALVALWALRLWHDAAESRQAKKEGELAFSYC